MTHFVEPPSTDPWDDVEGAVEHKKHFFVLVAVHVGRRLGRLVPKGIRRLAYDVLISVSPDVPVDLQKLTRGTHGWRLFWYAYAAAFIMCFGLTSLFTVSAGTWSGQEPNTVYFLQDYANLFLYAFVCPVYVSFSVWLMVIFLGRSATLASFADEVGAERYRPRFARFPLTVLAMVAIAAFVVVGYVTDILKTENVPEAYWFMTAPNAAGLRYLNGTGVYYVVLNFCLMLITAAAVFCFFSMFFDTLRVGHGLHALRPQQHVEFGTVRTRLATFTEAYLVMKLLCATYIVNVVVWRLSPLGATSNVQVASLVLAAMGVFFISFPRYYVELMWHEYQTRSGQPKSDIPDLRSSRDRIIVSVVDKLFVSTFAVNLLTLYIPLEHIPYGDFILETLKSIFGE